jgi:hypothetical protein
MISNGVTVSEAANFGTRLSDFTTDYDIVAESKALLTAWNDTRTYRESGANRNTPKSMGLSSSSCILRELAKCQTPQIHGGWFYAMAR